MILAMIILLFLALLQVAGAMGLILSALILAIIKVAQ